MSALLESVWRQNLECDMIANRYIALGEKLELYAATESAKQVVAALKNAERPPFDLAYTVSFQLAGSDCPDSILQELCELY